MKRPSICGVVVNYNYQRFLEASLSSLRDQSQPFDQLIMVDDGSTDRSLEVAAKFATSFEILEAVNGGQLSACLAALERTTCDYIYFLDADDVADVSLVEKLSDVLSEAPTKVQFQLRGIDGAGNALNSLFPKYPAAYDSCRMKVDNRVEGFYVCPPTSGNVFRVETLRGLRFESIPLRDFIDGPPVMLMPYLGKVSTLDVPLASYRVHGSNHSSWDSPTPDLLAWEIQRFQHRWGAAREISSIELNDQPDLRMNLFVLERELSIASLSRDSPRLPAVKRLIRYLWCSKVRTFRKTSVSIFSLLMMLPSPAARSRLIEAKRSPLNRPQLVNRMIVAARQYRRREG